MNTDTVFVPKVDAPTGVVPGLYLKLLGETQFRRGAQSATPTSKRALALVAYLALVRDNSAPRGKLAALFWADRGEAQARASLRQCIYEARTAIGDADPPFVDTDSSAVCLVGDWISDVRAIETLLRSESAAEVAEGVEMAGTEVLLDGYDLGENFEDWLLLARAGFTRRLAEGARRGLQLAMEQSDGDAARRIADQYLLREPGDEEITVLAMRADAARGAAPVAHRRFQKLREWLATELAATPGKAALDMLASLKTASPLVLEPAGEGAPEGGPPLLIVAPFEEAGLNGGRNYFGGVREEVVSGLSRFRDLRVLVEDRPPSIEENALFGASSSYVLTATLRHAANGVRVTPVLTRLGDRQVVWSNQIRLEAPDLQQTVDAVVDRIIGAVSPRVERDAAPARPTGPIYDRYLAARQISYGSPTHAEAKAAAAELEAIIAEAPDLAVAYAPLIRLYNTNYIYTIAGEDTAGHRAIAYELARTALALDRGHVHSYAVMGWCQLWRHGWDSARIHFEQAFKLNPYHTRRIMEVAFGTIFLGDHARGEALLQRCLELDPLPDDDYFEDLGLLRLMQNRPAEASDYLGLVVEPTVFAELYTAMAAKAAKRPGAAEAAARWRARIVAMWTPERPMSDDNLLAWINNHLPFREPAHRELFNRVLKAALF